jgi:hypothetical protein
MQKTLPITYHVGLITHHKILFVVGIKSTPHQRTKVLTTNSPHIVGDLPDTTLPITH